MNNYSNETFCIIRIIMTVVKEFSNEFVSIWEKISETQSVFNSKWSALQKFQFLSTAFGTSVFKKSNRADHDNCRPIFVRSTLSKILENLFDKLVNIKSKIKSSANNQKTLVNAGMIDLLKTFN